MNPLLGTKNQTLYSLKDKSKKLKCCLLQVLGGALGVNTKEPERKIVEFANSVDPDEAAHKDNMIQDVQNFLKNCADIVLTSSVLALSDLALSCKN